MTSKETIIIETIRGQIQSSRLSPGTICLFHERLTPVVYAKSCERPMTIQHVEYHRNNIYSLQNTSITAGMIDHEIQTLLMRVGKGSADLVILDGSSYEARVPQLLQKYTVVKGYQYRVGGNVSETQKAVLLSKEHISKQLEYEFKLGNGKYKPGFIGELALNQCLEGSSYFNAFQTYLEYSAKTNCPIMVNALPLGASAVYKGLRIDEKSQKFMDTLQSYNKISKVLQNSADLKCKSLIIYNIPFVFQTKIDHSFRQTTSNLAHDTILSLLQKHSLFLGFDLSRYSADREALYYLAQLVASYPSRIILQGGLAYKTDLTVYGGSGYLYYKGEKISEMVEIAGQAIIRDALFTTKLHLLSWKTKVEEVKLVVVWKCSECGGEQPETVESFRKFGKQFCSIKCLKGHKF